MPDSRKHRSSAPSDRRDFAPDSLTQLREAVADVSWLLGRGYHGVAPLKLVGDHFALTARQRYAVMRCACSTAQRGARAQTCVAPVQVAGQSLVIDGFNLLITLETALGGGVVLRGRDGCLRDLAHLRGTWRRVQETHASIQLMERALSELAVGRVHVWLDARVSNSGKLAGLMRTAARAWPFELSCETATAVDARLKACSDVVVTADSAILDACARWTNLVGYVVTHFVPDAWVVDLSVDDH